MSQLSEIIEVKLQKKLEEKKGDLEGTIVLDIEGPEGGKWTLDCDNAVVEKKDMDSPTVRIIMNDQDFIGMINGDVNPATAMFTGKLKIEGDMAMATKLAMAIR